MHSFTSAVINQQARTLNGMKAFKSSTSAVVDLFFQSGAMRGQDIVPVFTAAYVENRELALRIAAWLRDVRGGAGERQLFRDILVYLEKTDKEAASALLNKVPELGRWDDLFVVQSDELKHQAFSMLGEALQAGNGLAAKWTPRQGKLAAEIRTVLGMSPKFYRKTLVGLTKVVETQMCANDWDNINFSHVPSVAASRYKTAFKRHTEKYAQYVVALASGDSSVKINAAAIFPYDVLRGQVHAWSFDEDETTNKAIEAQWNALPNYVGDASILPVVDVSGSMACPVGGNKTLSCMDVAVSLGLYLADKNKGKFNGTFMTFSSSPELLHLKGNINQKIKQMVTSQWGMSTDLNAAMNKILQVAIDGKVPQEEMPKILLIMSDMQFNACIENDDRAADMIKRKYEQAGYTAPRVVFWNLNSYGSVPVKFDDSGVALVSGLSPAIVKSILAADMDKFTPESVMMATIMDDRYAVL